MLALGGAVTASRAWVRATTASGKGPVPTRGKGPLLGERVRSRPPAATNTTDDGLLLLHRSSEALNPGRGPVAARGTKRTASADPDCSLTRSTVSAVARLG